MVDYHMHTDFSGDSTANPDSMILTSIQKGANEICITDHCDPCYPDTSISFDLKRDDYFDFLEKAAHKYKNKIKIKKVKEKLSYFLVSLYSSKNILSIFSAS